MDNYQLYKTNVLLGGLVCWDVTIDSDSEDTFVTDFHLSPISHKIPFNYPKTDYELNVPHEKNISDLYKLILGDFYNGKTDPLLLQEYPIISDTTFNTHNNDYEIGCKRTNVNTYNKLYEFFCPVWLEHLDGALSFDIVISNIANQVINRTNIKFETLKNHKFHNQFVKYFEDYIKLCGIDKGNDNVINVNISRLFAAVCGILADSGNPLNLVFNSLIHNALFRERPVLESDSMLINSYKENKMIALLLFNFRFHFNLEDLIPIQLLKLLEWANLKVSMQVRINDEIIPLVDTYENYEFIDRKYCSNYHNDIKYKKLNVFDYLQDNNCFELINKNKIYQPILHWSLYDNKDYIFNLYDGFAGYSINDKNEIINHLHLYADTPDIYQEEYSPGLNNIGWCNCMDLSSAYQNTVLLYRVDHNAVEFLNIEDVLTNPKLISEELSDKFGANPWIHNLKYDLTGFEGDPINVATLHMHPKGDEIITNTIEKFENTFPDNKMTYHYYCHYYLDENDNKIYILYCATYDLLLFVSKSLNVLTFKYMKNTLLSMAADITLNLAVEKRMADSINRLYNLLNNVENIPVIRFERSLVGIKLPGPSLLTTEINYYKDNNADKYLFRYDGKIKPAFLTEDESYKKNIFYYKQILNKQQYITSPIYSKYGLLQFPPKYPSIGYFPIIGKPIQYENPYDYIKNDIELKYFNRSKIFVTPETFNIDVLIYMNDGMYIETARFIRELYEQILEKYNFSNDEIEFIKLIYSFEVLNDYVIDNEADEKIRHIYKVKLNLK